MTDLLYLSRARLRRDASLKALAPLLLSPRADGSPTVHPGHHLVWSLFADGSGRRRDFLWREMQTGVFLILSARPPRDPHDLFDLAEPKPFSPVLLAGDRLAFSLHANPVVRRRDPSRGRSTKHDIVMDALRSHPADERARRRLDAIRDQGLAWLERQASKAGFVIGSRDVQVDGYEQRRVARRAGAPMSYSTLDFTGILTVSDPAAFLPALSNGFGAAKAYGCGLMLIRRT